MVDLIDTPQRVVVPQGPIQPHSQPVQALANLDPVMDDAAVRAAIVAAEARGVDPMELPIEAASQAQPPQAVAPTVVAHTPIFDLAPQQPPTAPVEVPEKFLKPDGTVDVEKIQTSTKQLDEGIQKKIAAQAAAKSVDDYMNEYRAKEKEFRNLPNLDRLATQAPAPAPSAPQMDPSQMSTQQLEELIRKDYQSDPIVTTTRLIDIAIQRAMEPQRMREQDDLIRKNVESLATVDGRVLDPQVFGAITAKLKENPELWKLKNPHRAAWLEVKEELRLGETARPQAQPSRPLSPVLGGGTPPSVPSSQTPQSPQVVVGSLERLDLRDRKQEELGDAAIRAMLQGRRGF